MHPKPLSILFWKTFLSRRLTGQYPPPPTHPKHQVGLQPALSHSEPQSFVLQRASVPAGRRRERLVPRPVAFALDAPLRCLVRPGCASAGPPRCFVIN